MMNNPILKSDFYYDLPKEQIAQRPVTPRDSSRLLYFNRQEDNIKHLQFYNILDILEKGDVLVVNNTRVIPARLKAFDKNGRDYQTLLLKRVDINRYEALLKPAKKAKIGTVLTLSDELSFEIESIIDNGVRIIKFIHDGVLEELLYKLGEMPLPPYITEKLDDKERYQTVYSKIEGSSAAPTAGLHFTDELICKLRDKGIEIVDVLLHVGLGTFRPVKCDDITQHKMHSEYYEISEQSAAAINKAISESRRIIAVGTTSVRTLESAAHNGFVRAHKGDTDIFIYPPYDFKIIKGMITNFHLPESTLLMLVSAFSTREKILNLYKTAVKEGYRFFSLGDAMLIL